MGFTYKCCSTSFTEKFNLTRHIKSKHFSTKYKCNKCEFTTKRKDKLREHQFSKHKGNKFKCDLCGKLFSRNYILQRHQRHIPGALCSTLVVLVMCLICIGECVSVMENILVMNIKTSMNSPVHTKANCVINLSSNLIVPQ